MCEKGYAATFLHELISNITTWITKHIGGKIFYWNIIYFVLSLVGIFPPPYKSFSFAFEIILLKTFKTPRFIIFYIYPGFCFEDLRPFRGLC